MSIKMTGKEITALKAQQALGQKKAQATTKKPFAVIQPKAAPIKTGKAATAKSSPRVKRQPRATY